jgi:imidazolonepropionase-like amidohydrolase
MRFAIIFLLLGSGLGGVRAQDLAILDATVYAAPETAAQEHASVLILKGKIAAVGRGVSVPVGTRVLACAHCVVFAGFWNGHVHFTGPQWTGAAQIPATQITKQMQDMLSHSGFTTVVDTGSFPGDTIALRLRIENGEALGPYIYTSGAPLFPPHGIPFYLQDLPEPLRAALPQPTSPAAAIQAVQHNVALGTDIVKLFTGSYLDPGHIVHMPVTIARSALTEGHQARQLVFAHPSDLEGVRVAMESGVDVLAHAPDTVTGVDDALLRAMVDHHMAMIPTLKLFSGESHIARIREIVARFHAFGGQLIFGTDTGFLTDYSVSEEYRQLSLAGLSCRDVLTMLTTAPSERFGVMARKGRLRPGEDGDLTILFSDPAKGKLEDFANVGYTVRAGKVIFAAEAH